MLTFSHLGRRAIQLGLLALVPVAAWPQGTYTTNFPLTENPISEGGRWINGAAAGLDWADIRTTPGLAFGTQPGNSVGTAVYSDSTAILSGTWGPTQTAQATISVLNASGSSNQYEEVEVRLRTSITAHSITGYEINCSVSTNPANFYLQIVRWNGSLGSFTQLNGLNQHCVNGDVLKATISGSTITAYLNGVQVLQAIDGTFTGGSPGIGLFVQGVTGVNGNFGLSSFTATDGTAQSSFTLSSAQSSQTVLPGGIAAYTVTVAPSGGFTGTVNLSASGQPAGATIGFIPGSITTSGTSTLTVIPLGSTPTGSYPLTIKGTSAGLTQTTPVTLTVSASSGSLTSCDLNQDGATNVVDVQVAVNKYLSCTSGPNVSNQPFVTQMITGVLGGSCSVTSGPRTVSLNWTASTTPGVNYNIYRAAASGGYTVPLNSTPISGTFFSDCTVVRGQTYYYVIRSVDSGGNLSTNSTEVVAPIP